MKWTLTAAAGIFVPVFLVSLLANAWTVVWANPKDPTRDRWTVQVCYGRVCVAPPVIVEHMVYSNVQRDCDWHPITAAALRQPEFWIPWRVVRRPAAFWFFPLWLPAAASAFPAASMWRTDWLRARAGCCHACGYSRAGLAAGAPCPECAAAERR